MLAAREGQGLFDLQELQEIRQKIVSGQMTQDFEQKTLAMLMSKMESQEYKVQQKQLVDSAGNPIKNEFVMVKIKRANRKTEYIYANKKEMLQRKKSNKIVKESHPEVQDFLDLSVTEALKLEQRKRAFQRKYEIKNNLNKLLEKESKPVEDIDLYMTKAITSLKQELYPHIEWTEETDMWWALKDAEFQPENFK